MRCYDMVLENTRKRILDSAEYYFAHKGYHNCSLREITGKAKVNLAAVNYHFGSKKQLLEKVMDRRLVPLNKIRFEKLEKLTATAISENRLLQTDEIMRAFIDTTVRFLDSSQGGQNFMMIIGRVQSDPDETIRKMLIKKVSKLFDAYFTTLCNALPDIPKDKVFTRFLFAIGATAYSLIRINHPEPAKKSPYGIYNNIDTNILIDRLINFVSKGIEGK